MHTIIDELTTSPRSCGKTLVMKQIKELTGAGELKQTKPISISGKPRAHRLDDAFEDPSMRP